MIDIKNYLKSNNFECFVLNILSTAVLFLSIIFSFYIYISGKSTPGGGFQAGALLASGLFIYKIFNNSNYVDSKIITNFIAFGVLIFILSGLISICFNGNIFQYSVFHKKYGHVIGSFVVEFGVLLVVCASLIQIGTVLNDV